MTTKDLIRVFDESGFLVRLRIRRKLDSCANNVGSYEDITKSCDNTFKSCDNYYTSRCPSHLKKRQRVKKLFGALSLKFIAFHIILIQQFGK